MTSKKPSDRIPPLRLPENPTPYKDVSPDGWPGLLAALVVVFGVLHLFISSAAAIVLAWVVGALGLLSMAWYLRSFLRSRRSSESLGASLRSLKDIGATGWLGILAILFLPILLLTLAVGGEGEIVLSWIFAAAGAIALVGSLVSVMRSRRRASEWTRRER